MNKNSTRYFSNKQEKSVAKTLNGRQTSNSGATKFGGGDVVADGWLIECKTTMTPKKSFSIKKDWLEKNRAEMFDLHMDYNALAFNFEPDGKNYYIVDERLFKRMKELIDNEDSDGLY